MSTQAIVRITQGLQHKTTAKGYSLLKLFVSPGSLHKDTVMHACRQTACNIAVKRQAWMPETAEQNLQWYVSL